MSWVIRTDMGSYEVGYYTGNYFNKFDSFDLTIEGKLAAIELCSKLNGGQ
jgi:hypothetical protein